MGLNFSYGHALSREESITLLRQTVDRGVTFFDTAKVYGPFTNEEIVGEALKSVREQVMIVRNLTWPSMPPVKAILRREGKVA